MQVHTLVRRMQWRGAAKGRAREIKSQQRTSAELYTLQPLNMSACMKNNININDVYPLAMNINLSCITQVRNINYYVSRCVHNMNGKVFFFLRAHFILENQLGALVNAGEVTTIFSLTFFIIVYYIHIYLLNSTDPCRF